MCCAERAIQREQLMLARGPQNSKRGNWPRAFWSSSRSAKGSVYTSGSFRPSAVYMGRGVTEMSALEYMLYHQKSFATVKDGSRRLAMSHSFSPWTSAFDWRQSHTWERSL